MAAHAEDARTWDGIAVEAHAWRERLRRSCMILCTAECIYSDAVSPLPFIHIGLHFHISSNLHLPHGSRLLTSRILSIPVRDSASASKAEELLHPSSSHPTCESIILIHRST